MSYIVVSSDKIAAQPTDTVISTRWYRVEPGTLVTLYLTSVPTINFTSTAATSIGQTAPVNMGSFNIFSTNTAVVHSSDTDNVNGMAYPQNAVTYVTDASGNNIGVSFIAYLGGFRLMITPWNSTGQPRSNEFDWYFTLVAG